jgi:hypothetical protein
MIHSCSPPKEKGGLPIDRPPMRLDLFLIGEYFVMAQITLGNGDDYFTTFERKLRFQFPAINDDWQSSHSCLVTFDIEHFDTQVRTVELEDNSVPIKNINRQKTVPKRWQNHHS